MPGKELSAEHSELEPRGRENSADLLPETLRGQIGNVVDRWMQYNEQLRPEIRRGHKEFAFLENFFTDFFADRVTRAREIKSDRYAEVVQVARQVLPMRTFLVLCVDGRVIPPHFGLTADTAGSYRVAGGDPAGFARDTGGTMYLDPESDFAGELRQALRRSEKGSIAEVMDMHYHCAAGALKQRKKRHTDDGGLWANVVRKNEMVEASQRFVAEDPESQGKHAAFIQTTFNPENGFLYMGIERPEALEAGKEKGGYTWHALDELAVEGKILSAEFMLRDERIQEVLLQQDNIFRLNWMSPHYVDSAEKFWNTVAKMKDALMPILRDEVARLYPAPDMPATGQRNSTVMKDYTEKLEHYELELEERATLLMLNMYTGFLNNLPKDGEVDVEEVRKTLSKPFEPHDEEASDDESSYEYSEHVEQGVKVSIGTHPPYRKQMFAVNVRDLSHVPNNVEIAHGIVRDNRSAGRVVDDAGVIEDREAFVGAPVPVIVKEIVRKEKPMTDEEWAEWQKLDFSDLPDVPWDEWSSAEFVKYMVDKGVPMPKSVIDLISLREARTDDDLTNDKTADLLEIDFLTQLRRENINITGEMLDALRAQHQWTDAEFYKYLEEFGFQIPPVAMSMDRLRQDMTVLYEDEETREHLVELDLAGVGVISDGSREPRILMPFIKLGKPMKRAA